MDPSPGVILSSVPLSVLDLSPIVEGGTAAQSFRNSLDLARHAERLGYHRFWVAEHHSIPGVASAATSVVIAHVAGGTSTIRVGAGGIMLPNHAPLVIAEQFGTLEALFPGRIDLGLGRAPGSDPVDGARAAPRSMRRRDAFPHDVAELIALLPSRRRRAGRARGSGRRDCDVPIWILGSSLFGAQLAARAGPAVRVRVALRADADDAGDRDLSCALSSRRSAGASAADARRNDRRRGHGRRRRAGCSRRSFRRSLRCVAATRCRCRRRSRISRVCSRHSIAHSWRRFCHMRSSGAPSACETSEGAGRADAGGRGDRRNADLRSCGARAFV